MTFLLCNKIDKLLITFLSFDKNCFTRKYKQKRNILKKEYFNKIHFRSN